MSVNFALKDGLPFGRGDDVEMQFDVELRELKAADLIAAESASEKVVQTANGPALMHSASVMGYELLCRSVMKVGRINGPLTMTQLGTLSLHDLNLMLSNYGLMQGVTAEAVDKDVTTEGR